MNMPGGADESPASVGLLDDAVRGRARRTCTAVNHLRAPAAAGDRLALPPDMPSLVRFCALASVLTVALGASLGASATSTTPPPAKASEPGHTYPSTLPLTLEVGGDETRELKTLRDFTITAQREGDAAPILVLGPVDPFTSENTCTRPMPAGITGCVVNTDGTVGTLRINWEVPQAGIYRFVLSGKRGTDRVETMGAFDLEARD